MKNKDIFQTNTIDRPNETFDRPMKQPKREANGDILLPLIKIIRLQIENTGLDVFAHKIFKAFS